MILGIDVGNTNIVIVGIDNGMITFSERCKTDFENISELFQRVSDKSFEGSILSSVVPSINNQIIQTVRKDFGIDPVVVDATLNMNIYLPEKVRKEIGADIIAGLVAAYDKYAGPLAVVDMGTATTIFALNNKGELVGGIIHPGIEIELNALSTKTAQLPQISKIEIPERILGQDTSECIRSGVFYGHAGLIDSFIYNFEKEMDTHLTVILTGGLGRYITKFFNHEVIYDEALLEKGLEYLYEHNKKSGA